MKLLYRGLQHTYNLPILEVPETEILGHDRGIARRCQTLPAQPVPQPTDNRHYCTVPYLTRDRAKGVYGRSLHPAMKPLILAARTPAHISQIHDQYLRQNLERRLQSARAKGDTALIDLLESERRQLV